MFLHNPEIENDEMKILRYSDVARIPCRECGERMVVIQDKHPEILCRYALPDMVPLLGDRLYLRETVAKKLAQAHHMLIKMISGTRLVLGYAYRHPNIQAIYHEAAKERARFRYCFLSEEEARDEANQEAAALEVAGHPAGAAVDVSIWTHRGSIDMGTEVADFSKPELLPTFAKGLATDQMANRLLLREIMMAQGFAPFNGEWWHFSYGDKEWAALYGKPQAIYQHVTIRHLAKCSIVQR